MRKRELVSRITKRANIKVAQAEIIVDELLNAMRYALKKGGTIGGIKASVLKEVTESKPKSPEKRTKLKRSSGSP